MSSKEKILRVAAELFAKYGYEGTTIRKIAKYAGVNSAMVSYYFKSKQSLYETILSMHMEEFKRSVDSIPRDDEENFIRGFIKAHIKTIKKRGKYVSFLILREFLEHFKKSEWFMERYIKHLSEKAEGELRRGVESGRFKSIDTSLMLKLLIGIDIAMSSEIHRMSEDELANIASEVLLDGIRAGKKKDEP